MLGEFAGDVEAKKNTSAVESKSLVTIVGKSERGDKILCVGEIWKLGVQSEY